jgi:hypothetical protein
VARRHERASPGTRADQALGGEHPQRLPDGGTADAERRLQSGDVEILIGRELPGDDGRPEAHHHPIMGTGPAAHLHARIMPCPYAVLQCQRGLLINEKILK